MLRSFVFCESEVGLLRVSVFDGSFNLLLRSIQDQLQSPSFLK